MMQVRPDGVDPKYLKLSSGSREGSLSRRDLLFGPLTPRYEVVPAVEAEACTAGRGCARCIAVCPRQAVGVDGTAATIDKARCIGCGACLPACPVGAIHHPIFSPEPLEAALRSILARREAIPTVLVLAADGEPAPGGPSTPHTMALPSIAAVSTWLLLRAFSLGADGIVVVPCSPGCGHDCDQAQWQQTLAFTREVLECAGVDPGRLRTVGREEAGHGPTIEAFASGVALLGPHGMEARPRLGARRNRGLAGLLEGLLAEAPRPPASLAGSCVPFGMVSVQAGRCTLCGSCPDRCPTGALSHREDTGTSRLLFDHGACIACEACVRVCPEAALGVERRLDPARLMTSAVLAEDEVVRCQRCGRAMGPRRMLAKIGRFLAGSTNARATGRDAFSLCPDCRIFAS